MKQFYGFPARMQFTSIPNVFLTALLPQISDIAELKTMLHVFATLYRKHGYPRFVAYHELAANRSLMRSLTGTSQPAEQVLRGSLETAVKRGVLLHLALDRDNATENIYLVNDAPGRQVIARIKSGEIEVPGLKAKPVAPADAVESPDIFTLYEENIGMLTPMIADELREAEKLYPASWIGDAIREAVALNKRNWRYIAAILERWSTEGKSDGTYRRHPETDPDKYVKGKYGHMVQR